MEAVTKRRSTNQQLLSLTYSLGMLLLLLLAINDRNHVVCDQTLPPTTPATTTRTTTGSSASTSDVASTTIFSTSAPSSAIRTTTTTVTADSSSASSQLESTTPIASTTLKDMTSTSSNAGLTTSGVKNTETTTAASPTTSTGASTTSSAPSESTTVPTTTTTAITASSTTSLKPRLPVHVDPSNIRCRPRWVLYSGMKSSSLTSSGATNSSIVTATVAECLEECALHLSCVGVEADQSGSVILTSPIICTLIFNSTSAFANTSSWYSSSNIDTYVIDRCPEAGLYTCRAGYISSASGTGSTGGTWQPDISTLEGCQLLCSTDFDCVGVDYDWQSSSCYTQKNMTSFNGRRYKNGPSSLIQYTKVDTCVNTCKPSWQKLKDVSSTGSQPVTSFQLPTLGNNLTDCLNYCLNNQDCIGIQYYLVTRPGQSAQCYYYPASLSSSIALTAKPAPSTVQYRLVNKCYIDCVVVWRADVGARYTLLNPVIVPQATTLDQCALYCRQSSTCVIYQISQPASAPVVCSVASDYIASSRVSDVTCATYLFTQVNCTAANSSRDSAEDPSNTCVAWTAIANSNMYGGDLVTSANSLSDCQLECANNSACIAIDYNPGSSQGLRCFTFTSATASSINVGQFPGITHYVINRTCTGCMTWTMFPNSNVFGGKEVQSASNLTACQQNCVANNDCTGIDYSGSNPPGWRCYIFTTPTTSSISTSPQNTASHYDINRYCLAPSKVSTTPTTKDCRQTWVMYQNSRSLQRGESVASVRNLSECQSACVDNQTTSATCAGVDYYADDGSLESRCFVSTNSSASRYKQLADYQSLLLSAIGVNHYQLTDVCSVCRDVWTLSINSHSFGGRVVTSVNDLSDCLSTCHNDANCTAIDYNALNPSGQRCFVFCHKTTPNDVTLYPATGVNHYDLARNCCSISWTYFADSNMYSGWQYSNDGGAAVSVDQCLTACMRNETCISVDYDSAGCYLHSYDQSEALNVGQTPGVKHYQMKANCASAYN